MTVLKGYISYNSNPSPESVDIALATVETMRSVIYESGLTVALKGTAMTVKISASAAVAMPFCIINMLKKIGEGENILEATITTVGATGTGLAVASVATFLLPETVPLTIVVGIASGVISYISDNFYTYLYEGGSEEILNNLSNLINSLTFDVDTDNAISVEGTVSTTDGLLSQDLESLLNTIHKNDVPFGKISIKTDYTSSSEVLSLVTELKELAQKQVEVISPIGNYIEQFGQDSTTLEGSDYADTLIGANGEDIIYGGAGNDEIYGGDNNDVLSAIQATTTSKAEVVQI